jgi:hypothetical protein
MWDALRRNLGRGFFFLYPFILTGLLYKSQHLWSDWVRDHLKIPVKVVEPWAFDRLYFGIETPQGRLTPNEWWRQHTHWVLDLICGAFYLLFVGIFVFFSALFARLNIGKGFQRDRLVASLPWAFFWLNALGYITYQFWPAAPPWYVAQYGFGPVHHSVQANPAGALAFDQLLGVSFFQGMYGLSADVFGAVPSLHVAYPALTLIVALRTGKYRIPCLLYFGGMVFSAVYLNHHYVFDAIWGTLYAGVVAQLFVGPSPLVSPAFPETRKKVPRSLAR